jgi:hypothetical protein
MKGIFNDDLTGGTCPFMQGLAWGGAEWFRVVNSNYPLAREVSITDVDVLS